MMGNVLIFYNMPVLSSAEYNASYFDGKDQVMAHNAGYSSYKRWKRTVGDNSLGEYWLDEAKRLLDGHNLTNLKVLEIGCAKGFMVQDLNDLGVELRQITMALQAPEPPNMNLEAVTNNQTLALVGEIERQGNETQAELVELRTSFDELGGELRNIAAGNGV